MVVGVRMVMTELLQSPVDSMQDMEQCSGPCGPHMDSFRADLLKSGTSADSATSAIAHLEDLAIYQTMPKLKGERETVYAAIQTQTDKLKDLLSKMPKTIREEASPRPAARGSETSLHSHLGPRPLQPAPVSLRRCSRLPLVAARMTPTSCPSRSATDLCHGTASAAKLEGHLHWKAPCCEELVASSCGGPTVWRLFAC